MEYIAFDVHKHYTAVSVERVTGGIVREMRLGHQTNTIQEFLASGPPDRRSPSRPWAIGTGWLTRSRKPAWSPGWFMRGRPN
jgi:hypothetical protein